jgi:hypothetical protein
MTEAKRIFRSANRRVIIIKDEKMSKYKVAK